MWELSLEALVGDVAGVVDGRRGRVEAEDQRFVEGVFKVWWRRCCLGGSDFDGVSGLLESAPAARKATSLPCSEYLWVSNRRRVNKCRCLESLVWCGLPEFRFVKLSISCLVLAAAAAGKSESARDQRPGRSATSGAFVCQPQHSKTCELGFMTTLCLCIHQPHPPLPTNSLITTSKARQHLASSTLILFHPHQMSTLTSSQRNTTPTLDVLWRFAPSPR